MNSHSQSTVPGVSQEDVLRFLKDVLSSQDAYKNVAKRVIQDIANYDVQRMKQAISSIVYALLSPESEPMTKLLGIRFLKELVDTNNLHIIDAVKESELIPIMLDIALFDKVSPDDNRGRHYFGRDADKNTQTISNSFFRLILESIKIWSKWYYDDSSFRNVYENLLNQGVKFPQSYLYYKNANEAARTPLVHLQYKSKKEADRKTQEKKNIIQEEEKIEKVEKESNGNSNPKSEEQYETFITKLFGSREFFLNLIEVKREEELDKEALHLVVQTLYELNKNSSKMIENLLTNPEDPKLPDLFLDKILKEQDYVNNILIDYDRWYKDSEISFEELRSKYILSDNPLLATPNKSIQQPLLTDSNIIPENSNTIEIKPEESSRKKETDNLKIKLLSGLDSYKINSAEVIKQLQEEKFELLLSLYEIIRESFLSEEIIPLKAVLSLKLLKDIMDQKKEVFVYELEKNNLEIINFLKTSALFRKESIDVNRGKFLFGVNQGAETEKLSLTFFVMNFECLLIWSRWWPKSLINNNEKSIFLLALEEVIKGLSIFPEKLNYFKNENYKEIIKEVSFICIQESQETAQTLSSSINDSNLNISHYNQKVLENFMNQTYGFLSEKNNDLLLESPQDPQPIENHIEFLKELKSRSVFLNKLQNIFDDKGSSSSRERGIKLICEEIKNKFLFDLEISEGKQIFQEVMDQIEPQQGESDNKRSERLKARTENSPKIYVLSESQSKIDEVCNNEFNDKIFVEVNENLAIWDKIKAKILSVFEEEERGGLLDKKTDSESLRTIVGEISSFLFLNKRIIEIFKNTFINPNKEAKIKVDEFLHLESTKHMAEKFLEDFERVESQKLTYTRFRDRYQRLLGENDFSHTSSFYEINSDVDERKSVNSVFYIETQLVLLKEKYTNHYAHSEVPDMKKEENLKNSQRRLSHESARKLFNNFQNENKNKIEGQAKKSQPARIIYISNLDSDKKIFAKGTPGPRIPKNHPSSASSHQRNNSAVSSFKTMFDDQEEYKIPLKSENKKPDLAKSDTVGFKNPVKKGLGLEINLAKENMDLKEKIYELAEMNLRLIEENQILRERLSRHENIDDLLKPKHKKGVKLQNDRQLDGAVEDKLSSSMCIASEVQNSFRAKNFKTMKTLDDAEKQITGEKEAILAQLNQFSKQHLKKYEFAHKKAPKIEEANPNPINSKRDEVKHLSTVINNESSKPPNNALLRGRSQENYGGTNNNLNSSFDSKRIFDMQNNVNEPSAIPIAGSQNFFSRPSSQNNIQFQEEYQYIPGLEGKPPSRTGSRHGSRLEVVNNKEAGGVSRIESLLENIDKEGFDDKTLLNKNNLYDMEKIKEDFKGKERKPSVIIVNNQIVAQENKKRSSMMSGSEIKE